MRSSFIAPNRQVKFVCLRLLEENDEFQEFPTEKWTEKDEDDKDVNF